MLIAGYKSGSLMYNHIVIVATMPNPSIPVVPHNPGYGSRAVPQQTIYAQIPTIIVGINADNLPTPPRPLATPHPPPSYRVGDHDLRSPLKLSLRRPWAPFLASAIVRHSRVDVPNEVAWKGNGYALLGHVIRRLTGPGSPLKEAEARILPFLHKLMPLRVFGTWFDDTGPDTSRLTLAAEEWVNLNDEEHRLNRVFSSKERVVKAAERVDDLVSSLHAMDEYAVRVALDVCAVLGGVELPTWPPSPMFSGVWVEEAKREIGRGRPSTYIAQCRARDYERWGVPSWIEAPRRHYTRLELQPHQHPTSNRRAEAAHQQSLASVDRRRVEEVYIPCVTEIIPSSVSPYQPVPLKSWALIKEKIIMLLDSSSPTLLTFASFSRDMGALLTPQIWSGKRYEDGLHAASNISWHRVRAGIQESSHRGAIYAAFEIPAPWVNPQSHVDDEAGIARYVGSSSAQEIVRESPVAPSTWFKVEIGGYQAVQSEEARMIATTYQALGFRFILSPTQLKDAEGRSIPHSAYQIELLYKSRRRQLDVSRELKALLSDPSMQVSTATMDRFEIDRVNMFDLIADPQYINHLYAVPLSSHEREALLRDAPSYPVPPAIHSTPAEERSAANSLYHWELAHFGILEYGDRYQLPGYDRAEVAAQYSANLVVSPDLLPQTSPANPSSVEGLPASPRTALSSSPRIALPVAELSLDRLGEVAFATSSRFSSEETQKLRRLYLVLRSVEQYAPFTCSIFPLADSPYRQILVEIAKLVDESSRQNLADFRYGMGAPNSSLGPWDEKLSLDANRRLKISLDPAACPNADESAVALRAERYVGLCLRLTRRSRPHKRRKRGGRSAAADAESAQSPLPST